MRKPVFQKREVIVFRQFQRKGYSLFACLGREVVISVLSVATLSASKAAGISDETWRITDDAADTIKTVWLDDVGVTGSRAPLTQSQAARMVTVLSREEIAQAPVQSVNDLLKYAVGVDVRQRGALGSQTDVSIRGGTQEQITVLLNGINVCDPQTGHNVMDLPVQLSEIVRIEVLEGPAGRIYGTSSLVGAVNIVTRPDVATGIDAEVEGGSFGYAKAALRANIRKSGWNNQLSGSYARSDGYSRSQSGTLNTDYSGSKAFYQGAYDDESVRISWHAGIADKGWGSSTFWASPRWQADDQYEHTTKVYTAIQAETKKGSLHFHPSLYWNQFSDRYEGYRNQPARMKYNYNRCDIYGINLNGYFDWVAGRTAFGAELRNEDLISGNLGEPLFQPHHISGTDRYYTLGVNRTNVSAHLEHNLILKRLTVSAGLVAMKSSWSSMNMRLYPGIDVSYRIGERLKLFAGYNSSLRLPSFTEMYYKLQGYAANPHLKPEKMNAIEIGTHYTSPALQFKVSLYHHHGRNMIDWIMNTSQGDKAEWQSVNHTKINSYGIETHLGLDLEQLMPALLHKSATLQLSYSYIYQDKELEPDFVSQYALEYLRHKMVAQTQVNLWRRLWADIKFRWQDRVGTYTDFQNLTHEYRPFSLTNVRLSWVNTSYNLYVEANNFFNKKDYVDFGNVPQPGIWIVAGGRIKLRM